MAKVQGVFDMAKSTVEKVLGLVPLDKIKALAEDAKRAVRTAIPDV